MNRGEGEQRLVGMNQLGVLYCGELTSSSPLSPQSSTSWLVYLAELHGVRFDLPSLVVFPQV